MALLGEYELQNLKDSKLFYQRNPPKYIFYALFAVIILLFSSVAWSCSAVRSEEVENSGVVVDSGVNAITSQVNSTITQVYVGEGAYVKEGDVLFTMDASEPESQREGYREKVDYYTKRLELIDRLIDAIENDIPNPFINSGDEQEFYQYKEACQSEIAQIYSPGQVDTIVQKYISNLNSQRKDTEKNIITAENHQNIIDENAKKLVYIKRMMDQITTVQNNPFSSYYGSEEYEYWLEYQAFYDLYKSYPDKTEYKGYPPQAQQQALNSWYSSKIQAENQIKQSETYTESLPSHYARMNCIETMLGALSAHTMVNPFDPSSTTDEEVEYYHLFKSYLVEIKQLAIDTKQEEVKLNYISDMESNKNTAQGQFREQSANLATSEANIAKYTITAPYYGTVHYDNTLDKGMQIQAGQHVGSVNSGSGKQVEMSVGGHERARLDVGQDCRFTIDGLMQSEFGCVYGKILSISEDATMTEKGAFFKVVVSFDDDILKDKKGNVVRIVNGMTVKVWTTYDRTTYMDYFFDKLGI